MANTADQKVAYVAHPPNATTTSPASSLEQKEKAALATGDVETVIEGGVTEGGLRVHPQPTSDPLDPLNWSPWRKHSILAFVMIK